jgi:hypothetical protein
VVALMMIHDTFDLPCALFLSIGCCCFSLCARDISDCHSLASPWLHSVCCLFVRYWGLSPFDETLALPSYVAVCAGEKSEILFRGFGPYHLTANCLTTVTRQFVISCITRSDLVFRSELALVFFLASCKRLVILIKLTQIFLGKRLQPELPICFTDMI